jgi:Flp pilus assembly pilin Flp
MFKFVKSFMADEDGATTVDMTMLMAALVGLSLAITAQVSNGMEDLSGDLSDTVAARDVGPAW